MVLVRGKIWCRYRCVKTAVIIKANIFLKLDWSIQKQDVLPFVNSANVNSSSLKE